MSRVGKKEVVIPSGIKVDITGGKIKADAKGKVMELSLPEGITVEIKDNKINIKRGSDLRTQRALHGTVRSLLQNMMIGLSSGFQKKLQIQGVGYKAQLKGKALVLDLGFTHDITYNPPDGITIETPTQTDIIIKGYDKQKVGKVAAEIRAYYPPEPYKGKGIRYEGEYVRHKQGKSIA